MSNEEKKQLRKTVRKRLKANAPEKSGKSAAIWDRLQTIDAFRRAATENKLMLYLDFDHEVETTRFLSSILGKLSSKVVIPHCEGDKIAPYFLYFPDELAPGCFGILELEKNRRKLPRHNVSREDISVVLVPGLAFDVFGNRLGRGKGFYDRFLSTLPESTVTIGLAFECQVFDRIPVSSNDRPVSMLVTEERILPERAGCAAVLRGASG